MNFSTLLQQILFSLFLAVCVFGCAGESADEAVRTESRTFEGVGVVKQITPSKNYVNIDHEAMPGFMEAMEMFFSVSDTAVLANIAVEDSVEFTVEVKQNGVSIVQMQVIEQ